MDQKLKTLLESLNTEEKQIVSPEFITELGEILSDKLAEAKKIGITEGKEETMQKIVETTENENESLQEDMEKDANEFKLTLVETINEYLTKFTDEFLEANDEEIVSAIEVQKAEKITESFKTMVEQFGIEISEESLDDHTEVESMKEKYNTAVNENIELKKQIKCSEKDIVIKEYIEKIETKAEQDRFKVIAEKFTFTEEDAFKEDMESLIKTFIKIEEQNLDTGDGDDTSVLNESIQGNDNKTSNPLDIFN